MSFQTMYQDLLGIPGMNLGLAKSRINEAYQKIQNENVFSFQIVTGGWLTPPLLGGPTSSTGFLSPGTISIQPYTNIVVCDPVASAAILAVTGLPLITQRQFRVPLFSLYNIIGLDPTDPTAVTLKLDRLWSEPSQSSSSYMIYQAYYPLPAGYKRLYNCRDTINNQAMDISKLNQIDLAEIDSQREIFDQPEFVVPYAPDFRPNSATYGQWLVELWPHPISQLSYTFMCQCNLPPLVNPTDTLPFPLTDELVRTRANEILAIWKEGQKGDDMERGSGANWQFLAKAHHEEYKDQLRQIRIMDRHLVDLYFTKARMHSPFNGGEPFTNVGGTANVGSW